MRHVDIPRARRYPRERIDPMARWAPARIRFTRLGEKGEPAGEPGPWQEVMARWVQVPRPPSLTPEQFALAN